MIIDKTRTTYTHAREKKTKDEREKKNVRKREKRGKRKKKFW